MSADAEETTLVVRAQTRDAAAFEALVGRYQSLVSAYARHLLDNIPEAEDVAQEVFLRAFQELASLREPNRFGAWLKSIAWRECRGWVRKQQAARRAVQNTPAPEALLLDPFPDATPDADPWLERLAQTIDDMSEGKKTVLSLFYLRGLSQERISDFLDIPVGTVKRRLFEARQAVAATADAAEEMDAAERRRFVAAVKRLLNPTDTKKEPS